MGKLFQVFAAAQFSGEGTRLGVEVPVGFKGKFFYMRGEDSFHWAMSEQMGAPGSNMQSLCLCVCVCSCTSY